MTSSSGLSRGVEVIFTNIRPVWPNWTQKTQYSQINSKVRKMLSAEKKAKRFEEEVREACDYGDFWFTVELVGLRHEFHEIHEVIGQLMKAYNDLENVCLNNREEVY